MTPTDPERAVVDGIALRTWPAPDGADAPVAVVWPAMGVPGRFYRGFAAQLAAAGLTAVVADLRGTGDSGPPPSRSSRYGYLELADDVGTVLAEVRARYGSERRVVLVGHSLGGQAALLHLAGHPDAPVEGVALIAVGLPYWRLYRRSRGAVVLAYTQAINTVAAGLGVWPGWTFGGRQARRVIGDWAATARTGRYRPLGGLDVEAALGRVRTPVLALSFDDDRFTPHRTLDHLCAKLAGAPVERERLALSQADGRPVHFAWARESAPVAARIATFTATLPGR